MSKRICIVCEGYEEYDYISRLKECNIWSDEYTVLPHNAKSIDNVFAVYQNKYQSDDYDLVLAFCDTEMAPYQKYTTMCSKIDRFHDKKIAEDIVFFVNPCTLQVVLSHFEKVRLKSNQKSDNANLVKKLTGVNGYIAKSKQREAILAKINIENYAVMKSNISSLSHDYRNVPSTNFDNLLSSLESNNTKWVDVLKNKIDAE